MIFFDELIIKDSVEINNKVEIVWDFFDNLEKNYLLWHPEDHIACRWIKGKPHELGSIAYFEERLDGKLVKVKTKTTKVIKYKYSENKPLYPLSIFHPKGEYFFESRDNKCTFIAINYFHIPKMFRNKFMQIAKMDALRKHIKEEGQILKKICENQLRK